MFSSFGLGVDVPSPRPKRLDSKRVAETASPRTKVRAAPVESVDDSSCSVIVFLGEFRIGSGNAMKLIRD